MGPEIRTQVLIHNLIHTQPWRSFHPGLWFGPMCRSASKLSVLTWIHCVCSTFLPDTLVSSVWTVPLICILILILKSRPGIFSDSVFSDKTDCKSKGALFSLFGERKWKVLVLLLLLKLECTSTFFPYCNLFPYCSTFLPLPSCRCH